MSRVFQFDEGGSAQLKQWLIARLEPICDAEPTVLADYILALLKHDLPPDDLRKLFAQQLEDFLKDETVAFVSRLFEHLRSLSSGLQGPSAPVSTSPRGMKRRSDGISSQPSKYARDGAAPHASAPPDDLSWPHAHANVQAIPVRGQKRLQEFCRDYHHRGYCARGDNCNYIHDELPFPAEPMSSHPFTPPAAGPFAPASPSLLPPSVPNGLPSGSSGPVQSYSPSSAMDTYDASSAALLAAASLQPMHPVRHFTPAHGPALPMRRGGRGGGQSMRGGDGRGQFDSRAKSNTTLVVENVPPAHLTLDQVNDFFRKFGAITNISIDPILSKALVSFSSPHEARAAHTSPDVIFGNRFVRIYFQRLEPTHPGAASMSQNHSSASFAAASPATGASVQPVSVTVTSPPPPDPAAIERRRLEGELTANIDRQKALLAQLDRPKGELSAEEKAALMTSLREVAGELETSRTALLRLAPLALGKQAGADADSNGPTASAEEEPGADLAAQRAKLEALKQEAAALGIDTSTPNLMVGRGGSRGRSRPYRGARGHRGRGRGYGQLPRGSLTLDNRSTKILIGSVSDDISPDLREHLNKSGGTIEASDEGLLVSFDTRARAEQIMAGGAANLPGASSEVVLKWYKSEAPPRAEAPTADTTTSMDNAVHTDVASRSELAEDEDEEKETSWKR